MNLSKKVLTNYTLGSIKSLTPLNNGMVNQTWKVETDSGFFILQKVNKIYTKELMQDIDFVTSFLKSKEIKTFNIVKTKHNDLFVLDKNCFWRVLTLIDGFSFTEVHDKIVSYEAAKLLGMHHLTFSKINYKFKHSRPIKNNINLLYNAYKNSLPKDIIFDLKEAVGLVDKMVEMDLPKHLRRTVNHGDPKISNFIFSNKNGKLEAVAMIDLDDCNSNYNVLYELGSMFRSLSWNPKIGFDLDFFNSALQGYLDGSKDFLTEEELILIPRALKLNLLQLISRFIRDYFEDYYFEWDQSLYSSRKEHNLARAKEHIALYKDILKKEDDILMILENYLIR